MPRYSKILTRVLHNLGHDKTTYTSAVQNRSQSPELNPHPILGYHAKRATNRHLSHASSSYASPVNEGPVCIPECKKESSEGGPAPISCARDVVNRYHRTDP